MSLCSSVYIDKSAFKALTRAQKAAILSVGVVDVKGTFSQDEAVTITVVHWDENRVIIGTTDVGLALVNYFSADLLGFEDRVVGILKRFWDMLMENISLIRIIQRSLLH